MASIFSIRIPASFEIAALPLLSHELFADSVVPHVEVFSAHLSQGLRHEEGIRHGARRGLEEERAAGAHVGIIHSLAEFHLREQAGGGGERGHGLTPRLAILRHRRVGGTCRAGVDELLRFFQLPP